MKKFLVIFLISFISLIFGVDSAEALADICEPCTSNASCTSNFCLSEVCQNPAQVTICPPLKHATIGDLIDAIIDFIFYLALVVAPLLAIIGAFYIMTAAGDPKKIGTGKNMIIYTLIGFAIVLLAKGLIAVVENIIGVEVGG